MRDEILGSSGEDQVAHTWILARGLPYWLSTRTRLQPTTRLHYADVPTDVDELASAYLAALAWSTRTLTPLSIAGASGA